jgi:hypothetical protein
VQYTLLSLSLLQEEEEEEKGTVTLSVGLQGSRPVIKDSRVGGGVKFCLIKTSNFSFAI